MPPKRTRAKQPGTVVTTTTRVISPQTFVNKAKASSVRASILQRQVRALEKVIAQISARLVQSGERSTVVVGSQGKKIVTRQLQELENQKIQTDIATVQNELSDVESKILAIGNRVKTALDQIGLDSRTPDSMKTQKKNNILFIAKRKKAPLIRRYRALMEKLSTLRNRLAAVALQTI